MERRRKTFWIFVLAVSGKLCIAQGGFTATGATTVPRRGHTATLLADGTVLIAGGWAEPETTGDAVASAELYNPAAGTFSSTGSMKTKRRYHTATLLPDGRVARRAYCGRIGNHRPRGNAPRPFCTVRFP